MTELLRDRWMLTLALLRHPVLVLSETSAQWKVEGLRKDFRREGLLACTRATLAVGKEPLACEVAVDALLAVGDKTVEAVILILELLQTRNMPALMVKWLLAKVEKGWPTDAGRVRRHAQWQAVHCYGWRERPNPCVYWWRRSPAEAARITAVATERSDSGGEVRAGGRLMVPDPKHLLAPRGCRCLLMASRNHADSQYQ